MSEKIKMAVAVLIILVILPYIITYAWQGKELFDIENESWMSAKADEMTGNVSTDESQKAAQNNENLAQDSEGTAQEPVKVWQEPTEILTGILAGQIPMDAPKEVLRAQAVIVRTEYVRRQQTGEEQEQTRSVQELTALWGGENVKKNYEIAQTAVSDTAGEILTYEDEPIQTAYHRVSAGATREMTALSDEPTPYLQSVSCGMDITSPDYLTVRFFSVEEVTDALQLGQQADLTDFAIEREESGYVKTVQLGENIFTGDDFRRLLNLPSPCFYLKEVEGQLRVVVKGKGHGIGMSQYAAEQQAKDGASYQDILTYFFPGTILKKMS